MAILTDPPHRPRTRSRDRESQTAVTTVATTAITSTAVPLEGAPSTPEEEMIEEEWEEEGEEIVDVDSAMVSTETDYEINRPRR